METGTTRSRRSCSVAVIYAQSITIAEYLKSQRASGVHASGLAEALLAELPNGEPHFSSPDEGLSPARIAARRFMRENSTLMRLLAQ